MNNSPCIFCAIINQQIPVPFVASNNDVVVIKDRAPRAPIHFLIIPRKHMCNLYDATLADRNLLGSMLLMANELAHTIEGAREFRLISNNGASVGQSVFHFHIHFIAGQKLTDF